MQPSNICLWSTFLYSLQLLSFSWLVWSSLLFSWQFLLLLPKWRISKLTENVRIKSFIEYYHTPYTVEHHYWTGLLLIVHIILYLVAIIAAVNVSNDPTVAFTAITFTVCCIFALRLFFGNRLYRKWPLDVFETFFCLNIVFFATFTWYSLDNPNSNEEAAAYTSVTITIVVLLLIILYHAYIMHKLVSSKISRRQCLVEGITWTTQSTLIQHHSSGQHQLNLPSR